MLAEFEFAARCIIDAATNGYGYLAHCPGNVNEDYIVMILRWIGVM